MATNRPDEPSSAAALLVWVEPEADEDLVPVAPEEPVSEDSVAWASTSVVVEASSLVAVAELFLELVVAVALLIDE